MGKECDTRVPVRRWLHLGLGGHRVLLVHGFAIREGKTNQDLKSSFQKRSPELEKVGETGILTSADVLTADYLLRW